jgi:hypothetical protein
MTQQASVPEIKVGDWAVKASDDGDPELFYRGFNVAAGVTSGELRKASLDLVKLAGQLAAAGY